jgi:hypothetical protein
MNHSETRNVLIDKIIKTYELDAKDIADAVELYYDCQELRIKHANRERTEGVGTLVSWIAYWLGLGEKVLTAKLKDWVLSSESPPEAKWAYEQIGIGPIIAAGLAAHIDLTKADSISALWKFAGQAPGFDRKVKGTKLPYNARLKVLCWKAGESFVKVSAKEEATYGKLYAAFKRQEIVRNQEGLYKEAAARELSSKKFKAEDSVTKKRLLAGMLSDAHLHARAKRRTVKIFLAHFWTVGRESRDLPLREPYAQRILGHDGIIKAPSKSSSQTRRETPNG